MHVELIPADPAFAELWMKWRAETHTVRHNPLAPTTLESIRDRLERSCSSFVDLSAAPEFSLFARVDGKVAASLTLKGVSQMMGYGEIGYTVGEEYQGRGVGTAAVRAFVARIFADTPLRRLFALVAEENVPSRRLLERLGFRQEGVLREHYLIQGKPVNEIYYGILRAEWRDGILRAEWRDGILRAE
jgi:ribosomal-protein-alanine N-acetyltransferase